MLMMLLIMSNVDATFAAVFLLLLLKLLLVVTSGSNLFLLYEAETNQTKLPSITLCPPLFALHPQAYCCHQVPEYTGRRHIRCKPPGTERRISTGCGGDLQSPNPKHLSIPLCIRLDSGLE